MTVTEHLRDRVGRDRYKYRPCAAVVIGVSAILWAAILWALGVI